VLNETFIFPLPQAFLIEADWEFNSANQLSPTRLLKAVFLDDYSPQEEESERNTF
jgi:hypothetical protein